MDQHIGTEVGGRFTIEDFLGAGAFGEVYRAHSDQYGKVAIKLCRIGPGFQDEDSVLAEASALSEVEHPTVVKVIEVGRHSNGDLDYAYVAMEYVDGGTLAEYLAERVRLPVAEALTASRDMLSALACAHRLDPPIVHGDLKPANVYLISSDPLHVKVGDFGLARPVCGVSGMAKAAGTLYYMAPENFWGYSLPASDVFSAGLIVYQMLTGVSAFPLPELGTGSTAGDYQRAVERSRREPAAPPSNFNPEVDASLDAVVLRSLALRHTDRYSQAEEFLEALGFEEDTVLEDYDLNPAVPVSSEPVVPMFKDPDYVELACSAELSQDEINKLVDLHNDLETSLATSQLGAFSIGTLTGLTKTELSAFDGQSLSEVVLTGKPTISDLRLIKEIGKLLQSNPYSVRARRAGMVLYGAAIARALDEYGEKISSLDLGHLRDLYQALLSRRYLPRKYRNLIERVYERI